jgi:hypothetical protein
LVSRLEPFGRFEFDPQGSGIDPIGLPNAEYHLFQMAQEYPDAFTAALGAAALPVGGWTVYGAMRLIMHFGIKPETPHAGADAIRMAALQFLRDSGYGWERLTPNEIEIWNRIGRELW